MPTSRPSLERYPAGSRWRACKQTFVRRHPRGEAVRGACELLGLDPLYVASEGRFLAIVAPAAAAAAAAPAILRDCPGGHAAAVIGSARPGPTGMVLRRNALGTERPLDMLSGEQLPRIC